MSFFMDRREFVKDSVVGAAIAAAGLDFSKVDTQAKELQMLRALRANNLGWLWLGLMAEA